MGDRTYDQGVADGIRSGNTGLHELSKQITDLRAKLEAAEGLIELARAHVETTLSFPGMSGAWHGSRNKQLEAILEPANAEGIASEGGSAANDDEDLTPPIAAGRKRER